MTITVTIENAANRQRRLFCKQARTYGHFYDNIWLATEVFPKKNNMHVQV